MGGGMSANILEMESGVIPRVIQHIFDKIETNKDKAEYLVRVSFLEIYNEELKDLLHSSSQPKSIVIRETESGNIHVAGVKEEEVTSYEAMMRF